MPWDDPLARPLALDSGPPLRTLEDAANLFVARFDNVTHAPSIEHAIELLIQAANSGAPADIEAATDQVATVLRRWRRMT